MTETTNNKSTKKPHRIQLVLEDDTNKLLEKIAFKKSKPGEITTRQDVIREILEKALPET